MKKIVRATVAVGALALTALALVGCGGGTQLSDQLADLEDRAAEIGEGHERVNQACRDLYAQTGELCK